MEHLPGRRGLRRSMSRWCVVTLLIPAVLSLRATPAPNTLRKSSGHLINLRAELPPVSEKEGQVEMAPRVDESAIGSMFSTLYGSREGKRIVWGVFQTSVGESTVPSAPVQLARREAAAQDLVNIDADERTRRRVAGVVLGAFTLALGIFLSGSHVDTFTKLAIGPPLFLSVGFYASAREGL